MRPAPIASAAGWPARMKLPSARGCCSATPSCMSEIITETVEEQREELTDEESVELSMDDWNGMHRTIWRMKLWRAYPS
eukprot:3986526-Pyramimonas_sp.AAC.1